MYQMPYQNTLLGLSQSAMAPNETKYTLVGGVRHAQRCRRVRARGIVPEVWHGDSMVDTAHALGRYRSGSGAMVRRGTHAARESFWGCSPM